ncbi:MAG: S41 family peptidase [Bacteroidales bacterium]
MLKPVIILLILIQVLASCEKAFIENDMENTHENNFELLWTTIDGKYSFFEYKNINWDSIYHVYKPKINNGISERQFFDILAGMLFELRDGHVNLYSDFDSSRNWDWHASYPANFNLTLVNFYYLGVDYRTTGPFMSTARDSVGYVYIASFAEQVSNKDIDEIIEKYSGLKGIVIDVRNNSGGLSNNGKIIASRFADKRRLVSWYRYKTGPGHGDFSEPQPNYVSPEGKIRFTKPVVVLTNRRTYSATNDFVLNMTAFPHVTIMGDKTGGGGGTPYDQELLNGWRYRFPRTQTLAPNGFNVENGIDPNINVNLTRNDAERGIDTIIEAAIKYITEHTPDG